MNVEHESEVYIFALSEVRYWIVDAGTLGRRLNWDSTAKQHRA